MKKLLAIALVGVSVLGLASGRAFAWPLRHCWCCCNKGCHVNCSQYNAFSPWCCDYPCPGPNYGNGNCGYYPPLAAHYGDNGYASQLPAGASGGAAAANTGPATNPGSNPMPAGPAQPNAIQGAPPGYNQTLFYPTGMARPYGVPSYYPNGMGYAPGYGVAR